MSEYKLGNGGQQPLNAHIKTQSGDSYFFSLFPFPPYLDEIFNFSQFLTT